MDVELLETMAPTTPRRGVAVAAPAKRKPPPPGASGELKIEGVWKTFGGTNGATKPARCLQDIHLTVKPGEFVVMVGPSGCGKSTLLNIAAGMLRPDAGGVLVNGKQISGPGPDRTMVFQDHGLFPWLSAEQNIAFGLKMMGVPRAERADRVKAALDMVHLSHAGGKLVHELSGGMRQRVAIARALANRPRILFMDEPFGALDAQTRAQMQSYLQQIWLNVDVTIVFITHDLDEAVYLADRVVVLNAHPGRVAEVIEVPVSRPRTPQQISDPRFVATRRRLDALIHPPSERPAEEKLPIIRMTMAGDEVL